jgi:hypothetical protein
MKSCIESPLVEPKHGSRGLWVSHAEVCELAQGPEQSSEAVDLASDDAVCL